MPGLRSRNKGKAGEREFAKWLAGWQTAAGDPVVARRSRQSDGQLDQDLVHTMPGIHFEVTRSEELDLGTKRLAEKMQQASRDAFGKGHRPIVAWRRSRRPWLLTMDWAGIPATFLAEDWMAWNGYRRQVIHNGAEEG